MQNKKDLTNKETDDEVDEKTYFERLGLKWEIMSSHS